MQKNSFFVGVALGALLANAIWVGVLFSYGWDLTSKLDEPSDPAADRMERALIIRAYDNCEDDPACPLTMRDHAHWERLIQDGEL